jgi:integrase
MAAALPKGVVRVEDGHYLVRWTDAGGTPRKRNFRRPRDGRTDAAVRNAATAWKMDRESAKRSGAVDAASFTGTMTVAELTERWLAREARPSTLARDASFVRAWVVPRLGRLRVTEVRRSHVVDFVAALRSAGLAPESVRSYYGRLASLFAFAERDEVIALTPCRNVPLPAPQGRRKRPAVTPEQVHALADALPDEYRPVAYLAALGLRRAEVFGLQVGDLDLARSTLTVRRTVTPVRGRLVVGEPKTAKSARTIQVPANVSAFLGQHLAERGRAHEPGAYVVTAPQGGPVRPDLFRRRVWAPACEAAGLAGLGLHDLRHAAVALMREAGVPVEVASRRLGHASIRTTMDVYGSLPESLDRQAADALGDLMAAGRTDEAIGRKSAGGSA